MEKFNINQIIEHYKLDTNEVATMLFPYIKYPKQAFGRILKGEANLDTKQVENLASYIGVAVHDLYTVDDWRGSTENSSLVFTKGEYKVKLNYGGAYLTLLKNESIISQEFSCAYSMTVAQFIEYINKLIKNFENGSN